jgi:hypothetical protein
MPLQAPSSPNKWTIGPDGQRLTAENLPPAKPCRWVPRYKAEIVAAVRGSSLSLKEVCERYSVSLEEYSSWEARMEDSGQLGLRTTRTQFYRARARLQHYG